VQRLLNQVPINNIISLFQLPQEQGRSRGRRSTCRGRDDGHGLALRHGLPLKESVLCAAAVARQTAKPFQSIPATRMRCRQQRCCGDAHTVCCVHMWCLIARPLGCGWVCVWRGAGNHGGGGGAALHELRGKGETSTNTVCPQDCQEWCESPTFPTGQSLQGQSPPRILCLE
jgi:hypothetical protein